MATRLPYFDRILAGLGDPEVELAFGRHVHWGYWEQRPANTPTTADFAQAAEALAVEVLRRARLQTGQRVLDVGCGFGGTLDLVNRALAPIDLVGLNIDERQLARARALVVPRPGNRVSFVAGDACALPFPDRSFDVVLAVEAIFHFPDRAAFFREAARVLRPGGHLALCDFVPRLVIPVLWDYFDRKFKPLLHRLYGPSDMRCTKGDYRRLGRAAGLRQVACHDITWNTWPSFPVLRRLVGRIAPEGGEAEQVIARVQRATWLGLLRYLVLAYRKQGA